MTTTRLGDVVGSVLVTRSAAMMVARHLYPGQSLRHLESARRYLTEHACAAHHVSTRDGLQHWRARSRAAGVDVSLWVSIEGPLGVVVRATARGA